MEQIQACDIRSNISLLMHCVVLLKASVDVLHSLAVSFLKIGSGDANNFPLLQHAATKKIPLVVSTGEYYCSLSVLPIFWVTTALLKYFHIN